MHLFGISREYVNLIIVYGPFSFLILQIDVNVDRYMNLSFTQKKSHVILLWKAKKSTILPDFTSFSA